jgi:hypothetical protein
MGRRHDAGGFWATRTMSEGALIFAAEAVWYYVEHPATKTSHHMEQRTIYEILCNPLSLIVIIFGGILGGMWLAGIVFDALAR